MAAAERFAQSLRDDAKQSILVAECFRESQEINMSNEKTVESEVTPISEVAELLVARAGLAALTRLVGIDPLSLNYPGRVDYLAALEKQSGWLQALMQSAILAVAGAEPTRAESMWSGVDDAEREEVAAALRLSNGTAQNRIDVARALTSRLSQTCEALATGQISVAHANVIARESATLIHNGASDEVLLEVETRAIAHAEFHTPAQVANNVRANIARLAAEEFEVAVEQAADTRCVTIYPEANGMASLIAFLPAQDAQTIYLAIDKMARIKKSKNQESNRIARAYSQGTDTGYASEASGSALRDDSSLGEHSVLGDHSVLGEFDLMAPHKLDLLRADSLTQLAAAFLAEKEVNFSEHGRPVTLNLTIDLPTLLGMAENPGQLSGYGAIPASLARELAADAKWRRFITDPVSGTLLDYGRETYKPPQGLVDFLMARDQTCRFPGCRQSAKRSDIDHAQSWEDGGETTSVNLGVLCRRHHRLKTHGGWNLESFADGSCTWTSPAGKEYFVPARPMNEVA
jgi:Domain of unknown function (DUF222)